MLHTVGVNPLTPTVAIWAQLYKHPVPDRVKTVICSFWHPGTLTSCVKGLTNTIVHQSLFTCVAVRLYQLDFEARKSDTGRYVVWPDPRSRPRSRSWRSESCKNGGFQNSNAVSSANVTRLTANSRTSRQCLNFDWIDFRYSSSFSVTWSSNLGCSTFSKRILPLTTSQPAVPYRAYCLL